MDKTKIEILKDLSELYKAGILTKEEVEQEKRRFWVTYNPLTKMMKL